MTDREKLRELARLHDEAFWAADALDGHHKSSEGQITVHLTNAFERADGEGMKVTGVEVYAYVLGPNRSHYFDSVDEALATVRKWHAETMDWVRETTT